MASGGGSPLGPASLLVLHCFRAGEPEAGREICLCPELAFLEACVGLRPGGALAGLSAVFVESPLPETGALGPLPSGYLDAQPVSAQLLCHLLWRHLAPPSGGREATQALARAAHMEAVLSRAAQLAVWVRGAGYRGHTRLAVLRGSAAARAGAAGRLLLASYCRRRRWLARAALRDELASQVLADFASLVAALESQLGTEGFLHGPGGEPQLDDMVLYAHAKVLLALPAKLAPWGSEVRGLGRLQRYIAELDELLRLRGEGGDPATTMPQSAAAGSFWSCLEEDLGVASRCGTVQAEGSRSWAAWIATSVAQAAASGDHGGNRQRDRPTASSGAEGSRPAASAGEGDSKTEDPISAAEWRANAVFVAWCVASMAGFAIWTMRRKRS